MMMKKYIHFDGKFNFADSVLLEFRSTELCRRRKKTFSLLLVESHRVEIFQFTLIVLPFGEVVRLLHYISLFTPIVDAAAAQVVVMAMNEDGSQRQCEKTKHREKTAAQQSENP